MMNKTLPISSNPPLKCFNSSGFGVGVVSAQNIDYINWMYNNFTYLYYKKNHWNVLTYQKEDIYHWDCFKTIILPVCTPLLKTTIKFLINHDFYVLSFVNEYYIPNRKFFKNSFNMHDIYVYGYDQEKKYLYTQAYSQKNEEKINVYRGQKVKYHDFCKSYFFQGNKYLIGLKLKENYDFLYFDEQKVRINLSKYLLDITNSFNKNPYTVLFDLLNHLSDKTDIRSFKAFEEHKFILFELSKKYNLEEHFERIYNNASSLFLYVIKIRSVNKNASKAINLLNDIKKSEIEMLKILINKMN